MEKTAYQWTVLPSENPAVLRNCSKCGSTARFIPSNDFRINAQQKDLDVWLIYHCEKCNTTWNMEIFSRIKPSKLPPDLYYRFEKNDADTARLYSFDKVTLERNKAMVDYEQIEFTVEGPDILETEEPELELEIVMPYAFPLRLDKVLSVQLSVSRNRIGKLFAQGVLQTPGNKKMDKTKVGASTRVLVQTGSLKTYLSAIPPEVPSGKIRG